LLNLKYVYNLFGSRDNWYKYASFDLRTGKQLTYNEMFINPDKVLENFNTNYILVFKGFIKNNNQETDEEKDEYQSYIEHLETRKLFQLIDLNNVEFIYNEANETTNIHFHYRGQGGVYKKLFPNDYIEFTIEELKPYLSEFFLKRLNLLTIK